MYEVNIGLYVGRSQKRLGLSFVLNKIKEYLGNYDAFSIIEAKSKEDEPTLWVRFSHKPHYKEIYNLAIALKQEAIAIRFSRNVGFLIGPESTEWGDYNEDYFKRPCD